jgi:hypothetical protein
MQTLRSRLVSVLLGGALLLATLVEAYFPGVHFYQDYYLIPKEKYGVLTPLRWQEIVFLVAFWVVVLALGCVSYRLWRRAFRRAAGPVS